MEKTIKGAALLIAGSVLFAGVVIAAEISDGDIASIGSISALAGAAAFIIGFIKCYYPK